MEQSFLEKNLECIRKYDEALASAIAVHQDFSAQYEFAMTKCDDVNLLINGKPLHNEIDAIEEADVICKKVSDKKDGKVVHFVFGLGLGYVLKRLAAKVDGKIIIYEPNLDILRITLEVLDMTKELSNPNIKIVNDMFKLKAITEKVYKKDDEMTLSFISYYKKNYSSELSAFIDELAILKSQFATGYAELGRLSKRWAYGSIRNLSRIFNNQEIDALRGKFKDKPALIVSAGPSLDKSIEYIKKYRDRVVVFCVNNALKTLLKHGVKPDFVCAIEAGGCTPSVTGIDTSDINFIMPPEVNPDIYDCGLGRVFNYYTENLLTSDWIQSFTNISCLDYKNRGTVSVATLWAAYMMGCNPIILVGQNLAFSDGQCYAKDSVFDLVCELNEETQKFEIKPVDMQKHIEQVKISFEEKNEEQILEQIKGDMEGKSQKIVTVKGQNGESLPTSTGYALFIKHFEELIPMIEDTKLYNASEGGAQINGYENKPLGEILELHAKESFDVDSVINIALDEYEKPYNKESFLGVLEDNILFVDGALSSIRKSLKRSEDLRSKYKRLNKITPDLNGILSRVHKDYVDFIRSHFRHRLIMSIMYKLYTEAEDVLSKESAEPEHVDKVVNVLCEFFSQGNTSLTNYKKLLKEQKEKI